MTKRRFAVIAVCLTIVSEAAALDFESALTWQECVQIAAQNNPDLLAALNSMRASRADYRGSYNGILPQLSLSNSYSESGRSGTTSGGTWTASANASLSLIDFGQWASIQSSLATYKQSQASTRITSSATLLDLYRAFTGLLYSQEAIEVNEKIQETWKVNAQMVDLRYQSGRESKGNNMNTEAQYLQAKAALAQSKRDLRVAQQSLNQALGREQFEPLTVAGSWTAARVPMPHPDFDSLLLEVPQIQVQEAAVERSRAGLKSARSTLWPSLSANYTKGYTGRTEFPQNSSWVLSGSLNYPLFAGGPTATYYASQSAQRSFDQARYDLRSIKSQARTDLESAWSAFAEAEDQVRVQRAFLNASRQRKEESDVRYKSGLMSFEEWNRVVTDYVNFQTSFLRTQQSLILAEAQWRFAKGEQL